MHHPYQWLFILFISLQLCNLSMQSEWNDEPEIDRYQSILRRTADRADKLLIFQSIWGAIRSDFPNDTEKAKGLYTQLGHFILNEMQCNSGTSARTACELQQEVRRHLRILMAQRLGNLLNAEESIATYGMYVGASVEPPLIRDILYHLIEDIYFHRPLNQLAHQLEELHILGDEISFRMMIEAQLALYWRYHQLGDVNDSYEFNFAHLLGKIQSHQMYKNLDASVQRRVQAVHQNLPPNLSNLFHPDGFCLINQLHQGYIYTTVSDEFNYGINGRQVFLWYEQNYTDSAGLMRVFAQEQSKRDSAGQYATPNFALRGEQYKWYLFVDPSQGNRLAALRTGTTSSSSSYWTINFNDLTLVFRQGDLILCADEMYDKERRLIKMLPGRLHTSATDACRWLPVKCDSITP